MFRIAKSWIQRGKKEEVGPERIGYKKQRGK